MYFQELASARVGNYGASHEQWVRNKLTRAKNYVSNIPPYYVTVGNSKMMQTQVRITHITDDIRPGYEIFRNGTPQGAAISSTPPPTRLV